ncbi:MAG: homoserine kinase [Anaerolineales bacterium]|nr:homoserine kinase [Anaerolineales bacterium]
MLKIRVPATSANLGPGFDSLGLALDLWNEISFEKSESLIYRASGEGAEKLNKGNRNLLTKAYARLHDVCGKPMRGVNISAKNDVPMSSGLGSSAAAIVAGLFAANETLDKPLDKEALLRLAVEMEGHPDNVSAALLGGLTVSITRQDDIIARRYDVPPLTVAVVTPKVEWLTKTARAALPKSFSRADAVHNIGRAVLVADALREGDLDLLQMAMEDRIHQTYRLRHISGGTAAYKRARQFGAAALSGAGPSIILFTQPKLAEQAKADVQSAFEERGIKTQGVIVSPSNRGAYRA